ncbi:LysR family transcriptional regulator [Arthrobacter sp. ov118]|uniref:LysR family transcriptional regulator n=1 Tax=Arthrobacter sp. ov118 TaxID=1761747 RepID=UPI0008E4F35A|nr:LysR family transcriptional regulator [Arthrobacter sp. ov118]SFU11871.1 DNA-binding transcriptional regulator, LysR family [Arthrobacter sp. ov118]
MPTRISFANLEVFLTVVRSPTISQAAEKLNIAQPALSQQLRLLERRLGVTLLERDARPYRLTEAGRLLKDEAERLLADFYELVERLQGVSTGKRGRLRIGFTRSAMYGVLPSAVRAFTESRGDVELQLHEILTEDQPEALRTSVIDLGIGRDPSASPQIAQEVLLRESLVVAVPLGHPLVKQGRVPLRALEGEAFILFPKGESANFPARVTALCREAGFVPNVVHQAFEIDSALGLVAAGLGVTVVTAGLAAHGRSDVRFLPLDGLPVGATTELVALTVQGTRRPLVEAMLAQLRSTPPQSS